MDINHDLDVIDKEHGKQPYYYELLKSGEMGDTKHCQQQVTDLNSLLLEKGPEYRKRQYKVIFFFHDNAPSHTTKLVQSALETLSCKVLFRVAYSPDLAPSDYHLLGGRSCTC